MASVLLTLLSVVLLLHGVLGAAVDVALNKQITDNFPMSTCGAYGSEEYYTASELYKAPINRELLVCEDTSQHSPAMMVDGDVDTYWQTSSSVYINKRSAVATIDLAAIYDVEQVILKLGDAKRPRRIMLEKSEDGIIFKKFVIRVTDINHCTRIFGVRPNFMPSTVDDVVCAPFGNDVVPPSFETIQFDFQEIFGNLGRWRNARYLRISMSDLYTPLGVTGLRFYHVVITDLIVMSECMCFGHQLACSNATGRYACECGMFTQGDYCEDCQPFYNQQLIQDDQPCEACNCFEHADECLYDNHVAEFNLSLNANLERLGGGRCLECRDNTTGVNCELCEVKFFRPASVPQTDASACVPCDCFLPGCSVNPESGALGDCLMNNDTVPPTQSMLAGDCFCKSNIQGTRCDECVPGFFNLLESNPDGCHDCECETNGTVDGSGICATNESGQCPCKAFVSGQHCDQCMDEYYNLSSEHTQGCLPCECNPGGALSHVCNKETGQCPCRPNVGGRMCDAPNPGYFYAGPFYIAAQFERLLEWDNWAREEQGYYGYGYWLANTETAASATLTVPLGADFSGSYALLLNYRSSSVAQGQISVRPVAGANEITAPVTLVLCTDWCTYKVPDTMFSLDNGLAYTTTVTLTTGEVKLDAVVALPVEYTDNALLSGLLGETVASAFTTSCDVLQDDLKLGTAQEPPCLAAMFSLSARYFNGALACLCHTFGSVAAAGCEPYGGQCKCKPGVAGSTKCDQCDLEYYRLTEEGCIACNCTADNKICNFATGQCVCPPNVEGRQCERCTRDHWAYTMDVGCEACGCNITGSRDLQCHLETGVCACKNGVNSDKCDECLPEYKDFSVLGCRGCDCNEDGSTGFLCDDDTGQCPCKTYVSGLKCTECAEGAFYNDASHEGGCLECICMGITSNCQSSSRRLQQYDVPLTAADAAGNITSSWVLADDAGTFLDTVPITVASVMEAGGEELTAVQMSVGAGAAANWCQLDTFTGNLLALYHNSIEADVFYTSDDAVGAPNDLEAIVIGLNGSVIRFPLPSVQPNNVTTLQLVIREDRVATGEVLTRGQLMLQLTDATLCLPATLSTGSHVSSLLAVRYQAPSQSGFLPRALGNEVCICGTAYSGMSCEECAYGYRRDDGVDTHEYLGTCVACECNGHTDICDPDTGECQDCGHGTTGINCELCEDGKYGNATIGTATDCTDCPCTAPRVTNHTCVLIPEGEADAGLALCTFCEDGYMGRLCDTCDVFHYGNPEVHLTGTCTACTCNGNTEQCDGVTGECLECLNETTGPHCERCVDEWYGNASLQACQPCGCDSTASNFTVCDYVTGQCPCYPGVGDRICDQCQENMYGYDNANIFGCIACNCNAFGSLTLQCDDVGTCECNANSGGEKCEFCSEVLQQWGLPHRACEACDCSDVGTVDPGQPCEKIFGQCECKAGVTGRKCDECERLYFDFGMNGCDKCGECEYSLGNDTQDLKDTWETYWNHTQDIAILQEQDMIIQNLSAQIASTSAELGVSEDRLGDLTTFVNRLVTEEPANTDALDSLINRMDGLLQSSGLQENTSQAELTRVTEMVSQVDDAMLSINVMKTDAPSSIDQLTSHNQSAYELKALGDTTYDGSINVSFDTQLGQANAELADLMSTLDAAQNMEEMVGSQANLTSERRADMEVEQAKLAAITVELDSIDVFMAAVQNTELAVDVLSNATLYDKQYAEGQFVDANALLTEATSIMGASNVDYTAGARLITDSVTIIDGTANPLPIETDTDLTGITGWVQAADLLEGHVDSTSIQRLNNQPSVTGAEVRAQQLTTDAQLLENEFLRVQPIGQDAVDAIENYQEVVDKLSAAVEQSGEAQATMESVMAILGQVSPDDLAAQALAAETSSGEAAVLADDYDSLPPVLRPRLTAAHDAMDTSIVTWAALDTTLEDFVASINNLESLVGGEQFVQDCAATEAAADSAIARAATLTEQDEALEPQVAALENLVAVVQSTANNASMLQTTIATDVEAFMDDLEDNVQATVTEIQAEYNYTTATRLSIDDRLSAIEQKIAAAMVMLEEVEQPVNFRQARDVLTIDNPQIKAGMEYNEVLLQFKYSGPAEGLLFFTENTASREKILLQIVEGRIVYEYSNVDVDMTVTSKADLYPGVWFSVLATRYAVSTQLTVTRMDTGGRAVEHYRAESTSNNDLTLNADIYVGGLPSGVTSSKVLAGNTLFQGCIYNLHFDGEFLPIWQSVLDHEAQSQCCRRPPPLPSPDTINAVSFDGVGGYLRYNPGSFTLAGDVHLRLEFRTFGRMGTMLLADKTGINGYLGIFLLESKVGLSFGVNGAMEQLVSESAYDDGEWYQLTAMVNSTYAQLYVQSTNDSLTAVDMTTTTHSLDITSLGAGDLTFGGQNPQTVESFGPTYLSFSGCIRNFQHSTAPNLVLVAMDLGGSVLASERVNTDQCFLDVQSGIGIAERTGVASFTNLLSPVRTISFQFVTSEPSGLLMYAPLQPSGSLATFFSLSLYNGNVMLLLNQGSGVQEPLLTEDLYLSDTQLHTVAVDFTFNNRPRMFVNSESHTPLGAYTMSANMNIRDRGLYLGGVPETIVLDPDVTPVRYALVGGFRDLRINGVVVDYWNSAILPRSDPTLQPHVYLGGIPGLSVPAPPPYITTPAPPTTPAPSCAEPYAFGDASTTGTRFGDAIISYIAFPATSLGADYENAFSITIMFRALQPNGLLYFMRSSTRTDYFALYLSGGQLECRMKRNNQATVVSVRTEGDISFDDGTWWTLIALRVNDFLALIMQQGVDRKYYKNNDGSTQQTTVLQVDGTIYVGGAAAAAAANTAVVPFAEFGIEASSFQGCIRTIMFTKHSYQEINFNVGLADDFVRPGKTIAEASAEVGTDVCYVNVESGLYMSGDQSYVKLDTLFNIDTAFQFDMSFTGTERNGTLMYAYRSPTEFLRLDITDGIFGVSMGNLNGDVMSVRSTQELNDFAVCSGLLQTVSVYIAPASVGLLVNGYLDGSRTYEEFAYFDGFIKQTMNAMAIYIGGYSDTAGSLPHFYGCVKSVAVNGQTYMLTTMEIKNNVKAGCPLPPVTD